MIKTLSSLIRREERVLLLYGGGSIKQNGVYAVVMAATRFEQIAIDRLFADANKT
jgi:alcohol dehydrogenase YqhD (iron-dependent ADH family)